MGIRYMFRQKQPTLRSNTCHIPLYTTVQMAIYYAIRSNCCTFNLVNRFCIQFAFRLLQCRISLLFVVFCFKLRNDKLWRKITKNRINFHSFFCFLFSWEIKLSRSQNKAYLLNMVSFMSE